MRIAGDNDAMPVTDTLFSRTHLLPASKNIKFQTQNTEPRVYVRSLSDNTV
jgi:hypothetical protein